MAKKLEEQNRDLQIKKMESEAVRTDLDAEIQTVRMVTEQCEKMGRRLENREDRVRE